MGSNPIVFNSRFDSRKTEVNNQRRFKMTKKYDFKKTLNKFLLIGAEVLVAGLIAYFTNNNLFLILIPILEAIRNYIKHRED